MIHSFSRECSAEEILKIQNSAATMIANAMVDAIGSV
jgi:hypothetical protein